MPRAATDQSHNLTLSMFRVIAVAMLFIPSVVFAAVEPVPSIDCVGCTGEATVTSVFSGFNTYEWYASNGSLVAVDINNGGSHTISNLCPGVYQVQWTNGIENDAEWFSIGIPGNNAGDVTEISRCTGSGNTNLFNQLGGNPVAGGQWINPLGQISSGIFNPTTALPGFYTYTIDVNGCALSSGVFVSLIQNADPGLSTTYLICETYDPFLLTDVLAGSPDYGGQWFNTLQQPIDGFYYPQTDATGLFTYMIDTVPGCPPVFSTMFVIENQLPDPGLPADIAVCPNAVAFNLTSMLGGSPDAGGVWVNSSNTPVSANFDPLTHPAGTYQYTVQGLTPCPNQTATLTVAFTDGISAGFGSNVVMCSNAPNYDLFDGLSGAVTDFGFWTAPNGTIVGSSIAPATALQGNYTYTVDAVGCQPVSSVVNFQMEQLGNAGPGSTSVICETTSIVNLSALLTPQTTLGGIWQIGANQVVGNLAVQGGQTYSLTYTVFGAVCGNVAQSYVIQVDEAPEAASPVSSALCATPGVFDLHTLLPATAGFDAAWFAPDGSEISSTVNLESAQSGSYSYVVYSDNTCLDAMTSLTLDLNEPAFLDFISSAELCYSGGPVSLADFFSFDLPVGGGWTNEANLPVPAVLPDGLAVSGIYTYTIQDDGVCGDATASVNLALVAPLQAGIDETLNVCSTAPPIDATVQLNGASTGGQWLYNGDPATSLVFDPAQGIDGVYTYVVPAIGPCLTDSSFIAFFVEEGFAYSAGEDHVLCWGDLPVQLGMQSCADCVFTWSPALGLDDENAANPFFFLPDNASEGTFVYTVEASNGVCTLSDEVSVTVHPQPVLSISGPQNACFGTAATFIGSGALDLTWVNVDGAVSSGTALTTDVYASGTIQLMGENAFGCSAEVNHEIEVLMPLEVYFDIPPVGGCPPQTVNLILPDELGADASFYWTINGVEYDALTDFVVLTAAGSYDVALHALAANGCTSVFTLDGLVEVYPEPFANFDIANAAAISVLNTEVDFVNSSQGAATYVWDFGGMGSSTEVHPTFNFPPLGNQGYRVCLDVETTEGCSSSVCREFYIPGEMLVYVPNAFTPDFDGVNDGFRPIVEGILAESYTFSIYNRWGDMIFVSNDPTAAWYGQVRGGDHFAQDGAYVWILEVQDAHSAERFRFEGHVSLIR
jgi:gliding motility-associated-like protein